MIVNNPSASIEQANPTYSDLMKNAEAGIIRRGITRYLVPKNHEASERRHQLIGTPIFRKIIMGTVGRIAPAYSGGNYRLNGNLGKLDAANNFAFKASVFNEVVHTYGAYSLMNGFINDLSDGGIDNFSNTVALGINLGCVAVQRYNRARMVGFIDRRLQHGREFSPGYKSWTGIDNRAIDNFYEQAEQVSGELDTQQLPESQTTH